ncbi:MAG: dienelactone hydrolase family protein [Planctomycetota bacterium]
MSGQDVQFPSNGGQTDGFLAIPASGSGPGVIVLQEWWGLHPHIKDVCVRFAGAGFVALAPDLYHGESADHPDDAGRLMMALNIDQTSKDLEGAVQYLKGRSEVRGDRVGCVGFCMGGQLALYAATENPEIGACVDFYGIHPKVEPRLEQLEGAFLGHFAEKDEFVSPEAGRKLVGRLKELGKTAEIEIYDGCDHAFFNNTRPEVFQKDASGRAWDRTLQFLKSHLG